MARKKVSKENVRNIQLNQDTYFISVPKRIMNRLGWRKRQKVVVTERRGRLTIKDWMK
jgi:hypothetical protein